MHTTITAATAADMRALGTHLANHMDPIYALEHAIELISRKGIA